MQGKDKVWNDSLVFLLVHYIPEIACQEPLTLMQLLTTVHVYEYTACQTQVVIARILKDLEGLMINRNHE